MNLRGALTLYGTQVHAARELGEAKGRTLCGRRIVSTWPEWEWEPFDGGWHCSTCWHVAEKLRAGSSSTGGEPI